MKIVITGLALAVGLLLGISLNVTRPVFAQGASPAPVMAHGGMTPGGMMTHGSAAPSSGMHSRSGMHSGMGMGACPMGPNARSMADSAMMQSMMQMRGNMMRMRLTGNADHDFILMMIPHHQAAITMANAELRYGTNPRLRALARAIIAAQSREIAEMRALLAQP
ncbi:MAG TPA: DUF305 domain-containing protein [Candidatus Dormibacteraeota bacterium]|nr:DUF305 domain-containing protein [Candidatus Dormibacteraeota bacterium]